MMSLQKSISNAFSSLVYLIPLHMLVATSHGEYQFNPESHPNWNKLDHNVCGISGTGKIIGGEETELGEFPWLVLIGEQKIYIENEILHEAIDFQCGGSLINRYYVLSAAHCDGSVNTIRAGEFNLLHKSDCSGGFCAPSVQDRAIEVAFTFEKPGTKITNEKDILIYKVEEPFQFNRFVLPICLPTLKVIKMSLAGEDAIAAGWGVTNPQLFNLSPTLQKVNMKIRSDKDCLQWTTAQFYEHSQYNKESQLCAYGGRSVQPCRGDSGGPLFKQLNMHGFPQHFVLGVVSFGDKECSTGFTMFARVTSFVTWILNTIQKY